MILIIQVEDLLNLYNVTLNIQYLIETSFIYFELKAKVIVDSAIDKIILFGVIFNKIE